MSVYQKIMNHCPLYRDNPHIGDTIILTSTMWASLFAGIVLGSFMSH